MVSHRIAFTTVFLLAFQGYNVWAVNFAVSAPACVGTTPPHQMVIPAVIKPVFQPEVAAYAPSVGTVPALPPIIIEEDDNDNLQNLILLLLAMKINRGGCGDNSGSYNSRCGCGGYSCGCNGGWNCGCGCNDYPYPYPYPDYSGCGGYDSGPYPEECPANPPPREINLIIKTDSGTTCTTA